MVGGFGAGAGGTGRSAEQRREGLLLRIFSAQGPGSGTHSGSMVPPRGHLGMFGDICGYWEEGDGLMAPAG